MTHSSRLSIALLLMSLGLIGCDLNACQAGGGCAEGQICCEGTCAPEGTSGCECDGESDSGDCEGGGAADVVCCDEGPNQGTCTRRAECMPTPQICTATTECASSGEVCCQTGANAGRCVAVADCPCEDALDCDRSFGRGPWNCCAGECRPAPDGCDDAGPPSDDAGPPAADAGPPSDDAGPPSACSTFSTPVDTGAEILAPCTFDGAPAICSGGDNGQLRVLSSATGAQLEARDVAPGSRVYSCTAFAQPGDATLINYACGSDSGVSRIDRLAGSWSFVQRMYGVSGANVVQVAVRTTGGQVDGFALADSSRGRVDLATLDSFGRWTISRGVALGAIGAVAGVACIPDTSICVAATDANPAEYYRIDWSFPDGDPGLLVSLGTSGNSARNGACNVQACAFAEFGGGGVTILDATVSPPAVVETRAVGPEPLAVSAATIGGAAALVTMSSDDKVHALTGAATAMTLTTYTAPGTCAAAGPRTALVVGSDCVVSSCPAASGTTVRGGPLPAPD